MSNYRYGNYEKKYVVSKANGEPTDPKADYFVLRLDKDPHAVKALEAYAKSVQKENPKLAADLWEKIYEYKSKKESEEQQHDCKKELKNLQKN